jgi:transcriptional regulator with XRE-family HTH domain
MNQPQLGIKIADLRKTKGMTQEELSLKCNINVRTIQRIESGAVTPRSFTLNLIFTCLDYEIDEKLSRIKFIDNVTEHFKRVINGNFDNIPANKLANSYIKYAWIAGLVYFLLGFADTGIDFLRANGTLTTGWIIIYIILKICIFISAYYFISGFVVTGSKLKNTVLVISSLITIFSIVLFSFYDIISLFYNAIEKQSIDVARSITFGIIEILFGIGLLRLLPQLGKSATVAGVITIIEGSFFLTVILYLAGAILTIPSEILEIIILYKVYKSPGLLIN